MKTWAEGELLSASDLNTNFTEASRQPRAGFASTFAPHVLSNIGTSDTTQRVIGWVDNGVAPFNRLVSIQGKVDADVTVAPIIIVFSVTRVASGTAIGLTFNPANGTTVMQSRTHSTSASNTYIPLYHSEIVPASGSSSMYVFTAIRIGGDANSVNGTGMSVAATWIETDMTNAFSTYGGSIS